MRRFDPELLSGAVMLAVMLLAAAPPLFLGAPILIPYVAWLGVFVLMMAALLGSTWGMGRSALQVLVFVVAVVASWVLVMTGSSLGLLPILLVITAAISPYVVPLWAGFTLVMLNVLVIVLSLAIIPAVPTDPVETLAFSTFYLLVQIASLFSSAALLREQQARRELAEAHVELQSATALLSESARTAERLRIARELHDLVGHQLTVLTLELEAARHRDRVGEAGDHIDRADGVARELLRSVRATVGEMREESSNLAELLARIVREVSDPRIDLDVDPRLTLDEDRTTLIVRTVQEIVTNTIRHARAQCLTVRVRCADDRLTVDAVDDGGGTAHVVLGNGLRGLRERYELLGGTVVFTSGRNDGFRVTAEVPALHRTGAPAEVPV